MKIISCSMFWHIVYYKLRIGQKIKRKLYNKCLMPAVKFAANQCCSLVHPLPSPIVHSGIQVWVHDWIFSIRVRVQLDHFQLWNSPCMVMRSSLYAIKSPEIWGNNIKFDSVVPLRGNCTPDQFCDDCLCIFLINYNTLVTSKICFLKVTFKEPIYFFVTTALEFH